ncbi:hypothetical protein [uncultured Winogradskyella sp.]|uniref:hypothetical protein n=1 Tax=uncultured Winogradskyella sp. TaxID=395353 RepID=UPI00260C0076|nr:hypothetical protein [uncultured Winogradskyella sp.]
MNFQVTETFSNGTYNELGTFKTETEARNFFAEQLKEDGFQPTDMKSWDLELNKLNLDEDGDIEGIENIESQTLYNEGTIDRKNYKGESAINYGFESVWNAEKKELEYTFYFQGEKEEGTVLESELKNWYF